MKKKSNTIIILLGAVILILAIVELFHIYRRDNKKQISEISMSYIENTTLQASNWLDDILENATSSISNMSVLYGNSLREPVVSQYDLKTMADRSLFSYVNFVDKNGINMTADGSTRNVSDRNYFIQGMKGEIGMDGAYTSVVTGERMIVFYAPVKYNGEIIGVLTGHYLEDKIKDIMTTQFFDEDVTSLLCLNNGTLIANVGNEDVPDNIYDYFKNKMSENDLNSFKKAFPEDCIYTFNCETDNGTTYGCVISVFDNKWKLVQIFPSEASNTLVKNANKSGMFLQVGLIILFVIYSGILLILSFIKRHKLQGEKDEIDRILDGVNRLFSHFILLDVEADTYRYLNNNSSEYNDLPTEGKFSQMRTFMRDKFQAQTNDTPMYDVMDNSYIFEHLGQPPYMEHFQYQLLRNDELIWEDTSAIVLEFNNSKPKTILLAVQEITQSKNEEIQAQNALIEAYNMAQSSNHAKSEFLSRMSHDIRTPMNGIMGMVAIANWNIDDKERLKDCLNKINISGQHLLGLINEVLDMSKIESGKLELRKDKFNILEFIKEIADMAYSQVESKQQHLTFTLGGIVHENVIGDAQRLSQVLLNIIGNAVKFTPNEGNISIYMNEIISEDSAKNSCYEFTVTDSGIGMDESFIEHMFEPFSREDDSRTSKIEGSGLGMSIANNIVHMMNGEIKVKSAKGEGTQMKITVFLEYYSEEEDTENIINGDLFALIDKTRDLHTSITELLSTVNSKCDYFQTLDEACNSIENMKTSGDCKYSAILIDAGLLKDNSIKEIKERLTGNYPLIVLSDDEWTKNDREMFAIEVNAFLDKAMLSQSLIPVLKRILDTHIDDKNASSNMLTPREQFIGSKVLLVEDYDLNIEIGSEILHRAGFEVDVAVNGKEAVDMLVNAKPDTYKIVLMDIQMPVMNGYEATVAIRNSGRKDLEKLPILAMTANAFMEDIQKGLEAGMNGHISKPINIDKMMEILELNLTEAEAVRHQT